MADVTIRLLKPHVHEGVFYNANTAVTLRDSTARWLVEQGVAIRVQDAQVPALVQRKRVARRCCGW